MCALDALGVSSPPSYQLVLVVLGKSWKGVGVSPWPPDHHILGLDALVVSNPTPVPPTNLAPRSQGTQDKVVGGGGVFVPVPTSTQGTHD